MIVVHDQPAGLQRLHFQENGTPCFPLALRFPVHFRRLLLEALTLLHRVSFSGNVRVVVHNTASQSTTLLFYGPDPKGFESNRLEVRSPSASRPLHC